MLNSDISQALAGAGIRKRSDEIFADSARPDSIEELYRMGWNIKGVGAKHVVDEINMIKEYDLFVTKDSLNGIKELRSYSWKTDKNGMILNEPVNFRMICRCNAWNNPKDQKRVQIKFYLKLTVNENKHILSKVMCFCYNES